jgi:GntR family transcriptional regulator/MocR family aminotransferase
MLPYATLITLDRQAAAPLTQQLTTAFISLIKQGLLLPGNRLPGARTLADLLGVHRQTASTAYEELAAQGWIEQAPARAAVVSRRLPEVQPQPLPAPAPVGMAPRAGFGFVRNPDLVTAPYAPLPLVLDSGLPDARLAPLDALARNYRALLRRASTRGGLGYTGANGPLRLRQQLAQYLRDTRGVPADVEHVFTTRGSIMAMHLLARLLLRPDDAVVVGQRSYATADQLFAQCGARLLRVPVDEHGLVVDAVAALCRQQRVRLLYLTPHHHYPTTVTLTAARRLQLLQLAERYDFVILEDDYDFDYHYASSPILPLASADRHGRVLYVGSLSKALAPAVRIGYVVAPPDVVEELGYLRRLIDQQGDTLLELAVAELFAEGEMTRHLKRARKAYQQRRDVFCQLLREQLPEQLRFAVPAGGLAVWAELPPETDLPRLAARCARQGLGLNAGQDYRLAPDGAPGLRLGFASSTPAELARSVGILRQALTAES